MDFNQIEIAGGRETCNVVIANRYPETMPEAVGPRCSSRRFQIGGEEESPGWLVHRQRSADQIGQSVGLQALARALDPHHGIGDFGAGGDVAIGDQAFGQHFTVHHFALTDAALPALPHRLLHPADALDHLREFLRQQAHLVVVALHGPIEGDVLFNHHRTECSSGDRHLNAPFMAGVAHRCPRQVPQPLQVAEIHILERSGVGGIAVEQHVAGALVLQVADA